MSVCGGMCAYVCGGQRIASGISLETQSLIAVELTDWAKLAGPQNPSVSMLPLLGLQMGAATPPGISTGTLGHRTQVFVVEWLTFYRLSYHPSP